MARGKKLRGRTPEFEDKADSPGFFSGPTLVVFWIFVVAACIAAALPILPQYRILQDIEGDLAELREREEALRQKSIRLKAEARALEENPRYLESRARDPLKRQLDGETVVEMD